MRFLSFLIAATIIFVSLSLESSYAQGENFVLLYSYDEDTGDIAKDISDKGNDGNITDGKWTPDGKFGGGMEFNGESTLIEVPHHPSLNPGGDKMTVMAWFKPFSLNLDRQPLARKGIVDDKGWGLDVHNEVPATFRGFVYMIETGLPIVAEGKTPLTIGEWNHIAMTYDGAQVKLYLNGKVDATADIVGDINEHEGPLWIGMVDNTKFLHGIEDELAVLNIALTEKQINTYMEVGLLAVEASDKLATTWGEIRLSM